MFDPSSIDRIVVNAVGIPATFNPLAGPDVETTVLIDDLELSEGYEVEIVDGGALITALRADVGLPRRGDQIIADGTTWEVEKREYTTDRSLIVLSCKESSA